MAQYGDQDDLVIMPIKAVERRFLGATDIRALLVGVDAAYDTAQVKASLTDLLRERRRLEPGEEDDFRFVAPKQISETRPGSTNLLTGIDTAAAADRPGGGEIGGGAGR